MIRLTSNVPNVYVDESRDFQLLCRAYDMVLNGVKFDIDTIDTIVDTASIRNTLLPLLKIKLGFLSEFEFTDEELRWILKSFPRIVKAKGTKKAIEQVLNLYMRLNKLDTDYSIDIIGQSTSSTEYEDYDEEKYLSYMESKIK